MITKEPRELMTHRQCMIEFLDTFDHKVLIKIADSWSGNRGVNYKTTTKENLILLIVDSMGLDEHDNPDAELGL